MRPEHPALRRTILSPPPEIQTGFKREMPSPCLLCLRPYYLPPIPAPSFSCSHAEVESFSLSLKPGIARLIPQVPLSRRKIYVNRHVDTCSNVAGAQAHAERNDRDGRRAWKSGYWYAVSDFAMFREGKGREERAHFEMHMHIGRHTPATRTLGLPTVPWIKTIRDGRGRTQT